MAVLKSLEQIYMIYMYAAVGKKPGRIPSCTMECAIILPIATISLTAVCALNMGNLAASPSNKGEFHLPQIFVHILL